MPSQAKLYIASIATTGLLLLAAAIYKDSFPDLGHFLVLSLLALLASTLKIRLPGFTGSMSASFLFILIGIADFSLAETLTMACGAGLVQSLWKPRQRPRPVQVLFNVSALALSVAVAYLGARPVLVIAGTKAVAVAEVLAVSLYFLSNTTLVSGVISVAEQKSFTETWRTCNRWSFPYFLVGAAVASPICVMNHSLGWKLPLLILSLMCLTHVWYQEYVEHTSRLESSAEVQAQTAVSQLVSPRDLQLTSHEKLSSRSSPRPS